MQRKLKSVFRSSSRKKDQSSDPDDSPYQSEPASPHSPRGDRRGASLEERRHRLSTDSYTGGSQQNGRSRPLSSAHDARRGSIPSEPASQFHHSAPANDSIANDYHAYQPALSPVHDSPDDQYMTLGGDRHLIAGRGDGRHEEDVADRYTDRTRNSLDISKRKPLPATPVLDMNNRGAPRKQSIGAGSPRTAINPVSSGTSTGRHATGGYATKDGLNGSALPQMEGAVHDRDHLRKSAHSSHPVREENLVHRSREHPSGSRNSVEALRSPTKELSARQKTSSKHNRDHAESRTVALDGQDDIAKQINQLLDGVVDLRTTVDTDQDVTYAPAVTHEIIKPHEHEVIERKIFREIHNYEYYYRIQPVYDISVLPPRHWVPNPDGQGLTEIFADDIPMRTGEHRMWEIVQKPLQQPAEMPIFRTQAQIITHPTTFTQEGWERKETTIIHPPTLQDMTGYNGLVQPVHFDHKTGERWLGDITMMHTLREQLGQVADPASSESLALNDLAEHLPQVPALSPASPRSARSGGDEIPNVKRKPINHGNTIRVVN